MPIETNENHETWITIGYQTYELSINVRATNIETIYYNRRTTAFLVSYAEYSEGVPVMAL